MRKWNSSKALREARKPYLVRLSYVHADLSIDFERYRTEDEARAFCLRWMMASAQGPEHLAQRAQVFCNDQLVTTFVPVLSSGGMGADSAP